MSWMRNALLAEAKISPEDVELLTVTDSVEDTIEIIRRAHGREQVEERQKEEAAVHQHTREPQ